MTHTTISPVCVSCQSSIGHIYTLYTMIKNKKVEKYIEETGFKPSDNSAIENVNMGEFLTKCGIRNMCCRTQVLGHELIVQGTI